MSLLGSILLDQAVPAGLGCFPLSQPCQAAGREPAVSCTRSQSPSAVVAQLLWAWGCSLLLPVPLGSLPASGVTEGAWPGEPWSTSSPSCQQPQQPAGASLPRVPLNSLPSLCHTSHVVLGRNLSLLTCLLNLQLLSVVLCQHKIIRNTGGSPRTAKAASEMLQEALQAALSGDAEDVTACLQHSGEPRGRKEKESPRAPTFPLLGMF